MLLAVQAPLENLVTIQMQAKHGGASGASQPVLTLHFSQPRENRVWRLMHRHGIDATRVSMALDAIVVIHNHSRLLRCHPNLKHDFWVRLLASKVMQPNRSQDTSIRNWLLSDDDDRHPLRIVLDFDSRTGKLNKKRMDAIYRFMTEPPPQLPDFSKRFPEKPHTRHVGPVKTSVGLSFASCRLTTKCLLLIQQLLDRIAPRHNRYYGIDMLDLSRHALNAAQMKVIADIVKKNHVYEIEDIRLEELTKTAMLRQTTVSPEKLLMVAFKMGSNPSDHHCDFRVSTRSVSLAKNPVGARDYASICSALRYGCAFDELSLASTLSFLDPREREMCWRWLAFGIFYPRSTRFAELFKLRKIHLLNSDVNAAGVEAFANALYNPVAEFRRSLQPEDSEAMDAVVVCKVKPGATVYPIPDVFSNPILNFDGRHELEMLYSRYDHHWVCVVVPGFGLGWLEAEQVVSVERDSGAADERKVGAKVAEEARFDLVITDVSLEFIMTDDVRMFIRTIGRQLRSLTVKNSGRLPVSELLYHCSHLEHLDLEGCHLRGDTFRDLLSCLRGVFGRRLVTLNLNRTNLRGADIAELADIIGSRRKLTALHDLHLDQLEINNLGLDRLHDALLTNTTLAVLELEAPSENDPLDAWKRAARARLDADCQRELSRRVPLTFNRKLAFVSVVTDPNSRMNAGDAMDTWMFGLIFEYAEQRVQRKILWTPAAPPDSWRALQ